MGRQLPGWLGEGEELFGVRDPELLEPDSEGLQVSLGDLVHGGPPCSHRLTMLLRTRQSCWPRKGAPPSPRQELISTGARERWTLSLEAAGPKPLIDGRRPRPLNLSTSQPAPGAPTRSGTGASFVASSAASSGGVHCGLSPNCVR